MTDIQVRRTKIVATLGPATDAPGMLEKILEEGGRFFIDVEFRSNRPSAPDDCEALHQLVRDELLPVIGAEDIQPAEYHGR